MDLKTAIKKNNSKKVEELIDNNKTVEEKIQFINTPINSSQDTPLNIAAMFNNIDIVKLLVKAGAELDIANDDDETPLHTAVHRGNIKIVKFLIDRGANINTRDSIDRYTPLHLALSCPGEIEDKSTMKYLNIANLLIESGANLEATTPRRNNTPLHKLIETSIRISIDDGYRGMENSELYKAALEIVKLLIKKQVNINAADNNGNTPLHRALRNNDFELAYILMKAGADTTIKNNNGKIPLQIIETEDSIEDDDGSEGLTRFEEFLKKKRVNDKYAKKLTQYVRNHATANITKKVDKISKGKLPSELGEEVAKYLVGRRHSRNKPGKKTRHIRNKPGKKTRHSRDKRRKKL